MSAKKFVWISFLGILFLLMLGGGIVFVADPFYHYHKPWAGMPVVLYNEIYQTPGVAKNFAYDSAIVGSSMTENFRASWFDEDFGWDTVKLSYEGACSDDLSAILEMVFAGEREVKNIVLAIDDYQFLSDSTSQAIERPEYLYNQRLLDDVNYLWNKDALKASLERLWDGIKRRSEEVDSAFNFSEKYEFSKERVLTDARPFRENILANPPETTTKKDAYLQICMENMDNIVPFLEEHKETEFFVVFSPYSIMNWEKKLLAGTLEAQLFTDSYIIEQLLLLENVHVFYFQDEYEMITNLDMYMDTCHYREEYNHYIEQCIKSGKNEVTMENYKERIDNMYRIVTEYNFEAVWGE